MPQHTIGFFAGLFVKLSQFFRRRRTPRTPSTSGPGLSPSEPPALLSPESSAPQPPQPPTLPTHLPLPPQPPASTSQPHTPPPVIPPPTSTSSQPSQHYNEHGIISQAQNFILNNPQSIDDSGFLVGSGIKELFKYSMPDAFHDSAARYPPPKCHPYTRKDYISKITDWALGNSDHHEPILWLQGPFGVGKTAVAQSCAEILESQHKLAATLFFSRSNIDRDNPLRVFTSIAYQIATQCDSFGNAIDMRLRGHPTLTTESLPRQFEGLLVDPLREINISSSDLRGCVVIIDGLDECRGTAEQCEIIRIIAASARDRTASFRWFITSRPEDPIVRTMLSSAVSPFLFHLELPVYRSIDHDVLLYLTDEFRKIRKNHGLPNSWPSEGVLPLLVDRSGGLWVYITTIVRFITDDNSFGPEDQLRIVLAFLSNVFTVVGPDDPWTEMDLLYTLIVQRVPLKIRTAARKILLLHSATNLPPESIAVVLGLSEEQFWRSCASIQSVMEPQASYLTPISIRFYHASFLDFMKDPMRSKDLCIYGDFLIEHRRECLDWLHEACSRSTGPSDIIFPTEPALLDGWNRNLYYYYNLSCFWDLCSVPNHPFDLPATVTLESLQFQILLRLMGDNKLYISPQEPRSFGDNLPTELRDRIIRQDKCPTPGCTNTENVWIFGHEENETVAACKQDGGLWLMNNQDPPPGLCSCGFQIKEESDTKSLKTVSASLGISGLLRKIPFRYRW